MSHTKDDILPSQIVADLFKESDSYTGGDDQIAEIRPAFEPAIAIETEINGQMKTSLQVIHAFFFNEFEIQRNEFASLGPELENLQKNRPTEPEMIQHMDKVMNRFTELQRSLKSMIRPGLNSIQAQHLRAIRDCTDLYQKQNEHWSRSFASFAKLDPKVTVKIRNKDAKKDTEKAERLAEDDKDF
uniref:Biogenesis of lysosome-related organelles complex 1 subunit 5 n=1 Tax=Caenorhabditis tropicalis TaxID=1561998 RepID=A0A1I7U1P1_9PELO